ncbi:hypothetical protein [Streptomyces sp. NPDC020607]|uniref:hypothetical protein n=1 Tax=Streptomyces sp. NPDC020607 TaxID=3365082 RepID=UPI003794771B
MAVLVVTYIFRREVKGLLRRLKNLSAVGVDAEFSEAVEQASAAAEAVVRQSPPAVEGSAASDADAPPDATISQFAWVTGMAYENPDAAVMAAWRLVERKLSEMMPEHGDLDQRESLFALLTTGNHLLPGDIATALLRLKSVRNKVSHTTDQRRLPSPEAAASYVDSCRAMVRWLNHYQQSPAWKALRETSSPPADR